MIGKEGLRGYSKEPSENNSEVQLQEAQLHQPEVAEYVHDIIDGFRKGLKRTPEFVSAVVDHYFDTERGSIHYKKGESHYLVVLESKYNIFKKTQFEKISFEKLAENPEGGIDRWRLDAWSEYRDDKPESGRIIVQNRDPENTAKVIQEARGFLRSEFGEMQDQTPPQK
jgi:hypothetical protein